MRRVIACSTHNTHTAMNPSLSGCDVALEQLSVTNPGNSVRPSSGAGRQRCLWVRLGAIQRNIERFRERCGRARILAMVKALAYGTGLGRLASWLSQLDVHDLGVSCTSEGVALRRSGADQQVLIFLADREDIGDLVRHRLTPVIYCADLIQAFASALSDSGHTLDVHLKIDSGMHRLGIDPSNAVACAREIKNSGCMRLKGVCTHFAAADDAGADDFTRRQIAVFDETLKALRAAGFDRLQIHAANSAAAVRFPQAHYTMVRVGLGLYGLYSTAAVEDAMRLELGIGVTSRIVRIIQLAAGETAGYNRAFTATRRTRLGVIPFGYDDGLPWSLSGKGYVLVAGLPAPIAGRISMDQMQIDITDLPGIGVGAEVLLYGTHNSHTLRPELVAEQAGTIGHELLTRLGPRVERIYLE